MFNEIINFFIDKFILFTEEHPAIFVLILISLLILFLAFIISQFKKIKNFIFQTIARKLNVGARYAYEGSFSSWSDYVKLNNIIKKQLEKQLKKLPDNYFFEKNVYIKSDNVSVFYDFVVFSNYGIFPVTVLNTMGVLSGSAKSKKILHIPNKSKTFEITNPIYDCIKKKNKFIQIINHQKEKSGIKPIIALSDNCRISMPYSLNFINVKEINKYILSFPAPCFSAEQIKTYRNKIIQSSVYEKKEIKKEQQRIMIETRKDYRNAKVNEYEY